MGKKLVSYKGQPTSNTHIRKTVQTMVENAIYSRTELLKSLIDEGGKDLNDSCGYPDIITIQKYQLMYEREGIAARVVNIWPEESWSHLPEIYESEDPNIETEFERKWKELSENFNILSLLSKADILSGIGRFGVILIGIDDGLPLDQPINGFGGEEIVHNILYLRAFQEFSVDVAETEKDITSPRYSLPTYYQINFTDDKNSLSQRVHWHRIVHLADNRQMSEIYGEPRMKKSYNRLLDVRKILGGSGEMFWKGGFPGYSFEVSSDDGTGVDLDTASLREEMQAYMLGMQRYLALEGVTAKSLAPQVADPEHHLECQLNAIAIAEGVPKRILYGSEQGELASSQDARTWNRRISRRREVYLTPHVVRPFIDRLMDLGILIRVEKYFVDWADLGTQTDKEKAENTRLWADAMAKWVAGDVGSVIPLQEFLSIFGKLSTSQIKQIMQAQEDIIKEEEDLDYDLREKELGTTMEPKSLRKQI